MKVYVHYEGDPPLTMALGGPDVASLTCSQVLQKFLVVYRKENPATTLHDQAHIELYKSGSRKALPVTSALQGKVKDKDDLYIEVVNHTQSPARKKLEGAGEAEASGSSTSAASVDLEEKLNKLTTSGNESNEDLLREGAKYVESGLLNRAVIMLKQALVLEPHNQTILQQLVKIYLDAGQVSVARDYAKKLKDSHPSNAEYIFRYAECLLAHKEADSAIETLKEYASALKQKHTATKELKHKIQIALCRAYQMKDQRDMAIVLIQGVANEDRENLEALVEYASLTYGLGDEQSEEAMTIVLTALVCNKDSKYFKKKFVSVCQKKGALKYLEKVTGEDWQKASVAAFLATTLRDLGAVKEALSLFEHSLTLEPNHANIFLTYVHTLELIEEHTKAVNKIHEYLSRNGQKKLAGLPLDSFLGCLPQKDTNVYMLRQPASSLLEFSDRHVTSEKYTEDDLYILATLFTLAKILYVKGALDYIPMLTMQLESLEKDKGLHTTIIRNEAAYLGCIQKIVSLDALPSSPCSEDNFIYFVGDSHCITPAWRSISYKGETYTIHPVLSTGTKIWHLRPGATFYPKVDFEHSIKVIPKKAKVIFAFGEIDCRESILLCVEKCKYDNLEEAMERVIDIYIALMKQLTRQHRWTIFVHPVSPVLDVTRRIVLKFNERLKVRVEKEANLKWLDFLSKLLTEDQSKLLPEYEFDQTHLHPRYADLLTKSLK